MDTILFIIKKRWQLFFAKENNAEKMLSLLSVVGFLYIPKLLSEALQSSGIPNQYILFIACNIILFAPLLSLFFPAFVPKRDILPSYLPLSKTTLFFLDFTASLGKRAPLSIIAMTIGFLYFFHFPDSAYYLCIVSAGLISLLFAEGIVNIVTWQKQQWWLTIITVVMISILPKWIHLGINAILLLQAIAILLLTLTLWQTYTIAPPKRRTTRTITASEHLGANVIIFKSLLRNKMAQKALLLMFSVKIFFLFGMPLLSKSYQIGSELPAIYLIFLSPIFVFTGIFNNSFGYFKSLYFSLWLYQDKPVAYFRVFTALLFPVLIFDATIAMVFLAWTKLFTWENILLYLSSTAYLIIVGTICSCLMPKKVDAKSISSVQKNTSSMAGLISMVPMAGAMILHLKNLLPVQLICLCGSLLAIPILIKLYGRGWQMSINKVLK